MGDSEKLFVDPVTGQTRWVSINTMPPPPSPQLPAVPTMFNTMQPPQLPLPPVPTMFNAEKLAVDPITGRTQWVSTPTTAAPSPNAPFFSDPTAAPSPTSPALGSFGVAAPPPQPSGVPPGASSVQKPAPPPKPAPKSEAAPKKEVAPQKEAAGLKAPVSFWEDVQYQLNLRAQWGQLQRFVGLRDYEYEFKNKSGFPVKVRVTGPQWDKDRKVLVKAAGQGLPQKDVVEFDMETGETLSRQIHVDHAAWITVEASIQGTQTKLLRFTNPYSGPIVIPPPPSLGHGAGGAKPPADPAHDNAGGKPIAATDHAPSSLSHGAGGAKPTADPVHDNAEGKPIAVPDHASDGGKTVTGSDHAGGGAKPDAGSDHGVPQTDAMQNYLAHPPMEYRQGEPILAFSKSFGRWMDAIVLQPYIDGSIHVQFVETAHQELLSPSEWKMHTYR